MVIPKVEFVGADPMDVIAFISHPSTRPEAEDVVNIVFSGNRDVYSELPRVTLHENEKSFLEVLGLVAERSDLAYSIEDNWVYVGQRISPARVDVSDVSLREYLDAITLPQVSFRKAKIADVFAYLSLQVEDYRVTNNEGMPRVRFVNTTKEARRTGVALSLDAVAVSVYDVLRMLTQIAPIEVKLESGSVTYAETSSTSTREKGNSEGDREE
jgi:hypothetical protein